MLKVNINDTKKMLIVALLVSLLLTLNMFHTFLYSVSFAEFEQLRCVALLDINKTCMRLINLYDLWCMNLRFISSLHECLVSWFSTNAVLNYMLLA